MKETISLSPFKHLCMTIGNLPSSYVDSMSYYECLLWLINYLQKTVIPVINNNAEAVKEIQEWIKTLDLQDEVDKKLDEMAESGELEEIITEYLQINGVLAFNTVSNMISATNIINGSICRTLGLNTYKDGKGAFYKIRTITSQDVVDGINIIALNISNTLIAEKIPDKPLKHIIIIGDSYGAGITTVGQTTSNVTPYTEYARQFIGYPTTHFHAFGSNGAGFTHLGSGGYTFLTSLKTFDTSLSSVADDVSEIYVFGGINDRDSSISDILNAIKDFVDYAKLKYPNAKVYIGELGRFNGLSFADEHSKIQQVSIPAYSQCQQVGAIYISGTEHIMQINSLFSDDNVHPSENGYVIVGKYIGQAILNKYCNVTKEIANVTLTPNSNITFTTFEFPLTEKINNDEIYLLSSQVTLNSSSPIAWNSGNILKIADFVLPYGNVSLGTGISEDVIVIINDSSLNKTFIVPGKLLFQRNGELGLYAPVIDSTGNSYIAFTNVRAISMKLQYQTKQISGNLL